MPVSNVCNQYFIRESSCVLELFYYYYYFFLFFIPSGVKFPRVKSKVKSKRKAIIIIIIIIFEVVYIHTGTVGECVQLETLVALTRVISDAVEANMITR